MSGHTSCQQSRSYSATHANDAQTTQTSTGHARRRMVAWDLEKHANGSPNCERCEHDVKKCRLSSKRIHVLRENKFWTQILVRA